ncbi:radical SAM protein [Fundidesulfovibrio terrae]|uniref:radical SAM protein n=1 Tax=Fundidesulfovibrio terrae TaxID=2922866 RepID=UPI001FAEC132|nr:radical SAM protein [Fundidesulfovibrio terrae]
MQADGHGLIFGPVRSGRLGASLGLDLLGAKICSFDCLYCEVGHTRALTRTRKPYVPADRLLGELAGWLFSPHPDFEVVTLGGMGEPTLNSDMGRIIEGVRELVPGVPVAVLTNSSLINDPQVRTELALADIVLPSMDSLVPTEFAAINKPLSGMSLVDIRRGLLEFRKCFTGKLCLEVLVLAGVNDSLENLQRLRAFVAELAPDRVDVVTMTRPGAYPQALPAPPETLERFREGLCLATESVAPEPEKAKHFGLALDNPAQEELQALSMRVLDSLARRPQSAQGLAQALGVAQEPLLNLLDDLARRGLVKPTRLGGETFYLRGDGSRA